LHPAPANIRVTANAIAPATEPATEPATVTAKRPVSTPNTDKDPPYSLYMLIFLVVIVLFPKGAVLIMILLILCTC